MWEEGEVLEHRPDATLLRRNEMIGPRASWPSSSTRPDVGRATPAAILSSVVLPQPEGPSRHSTSPGQHVEGYVVQREVRAVTL
jgi:hypothetical protein